MIPAPLRSRSALFRMIWICLALSLVGLIAATVRLQIDRSGTADAGQYNLVRLLPFLMGSACVWLGLTVLWRQLRGQCGQSDHHLFWRNGAVVFGVALLMRIIVLACSDAALSDDIYRYVFD